MEVRQQTQIWNLIPVCSHFFEGLFYTCFFIGFSFHNPIRLYIILLSLKLYSKSINNTYSESENRSMWNEKQRRSRKQLWNHNYSMFCKKNPKRILKSIHRWKKSQKRPLSLRWRDVRFSRHWAFLGGVGTETKSSNQNLSVTNIKYCPQS